MEVGERPTVFISYSHRDEDWKDRLLVQLGVLQHEGFLDLWDDRRISAGAEWSEEIQTAMDTASVAVLMISADFLNSSFILGKEIPRLLQHRAQKGMRIVPIVIRPCAWEAVGWLRRMQLRPKDGRPLCVGDDSQIDSDLAAIANEVYRLLKPVVIRPLSEFIPPLPDKISISRLPVTGRSLFGRHQQLKSLDQAWVSQAINIVSLIAWGGVGKSALINHWLRRMAHDNYRGAERVFAWSFYRQGTSQRVVSADEFIAAALSWFNDSDPTKGSAWDKGERLARLVGEQRTLLLLDGLEPLQFPPGPQEGRLKDQALQSLLRELAAQNPGLCVISTRISVADLTDFEGSTVIPLNLENLSPKAGAQILRAHGVVGENAELERAAREYDGHSLALTLLGSYLSDVHKGDILRRQEVNLQEDVRHGSHAHKVMAAYERWFEEGPEMEVLRLVSLFDRPADARAIAALRNAPPIPGLTDSLQHLRTSEWQQVLSRLRRAKLLTEIDPSEPGTLDAHPLVREHFARKIRNENKEAWREGHNRLYEHFQDEAREFPETIREMESLFMAMAHGCNAGRHRDALHEIYIPRIMRGEQSYAARQLGTYGALLTVLSYFCEGGDWSKPVTPQLPERQGLEPKDQLRVLTQAGLFLTATRGYTSEDAKSCYKRIQELCLELGETSLLYSVLVSRWRYSLVSNNLAITLELAKEVYDLARSLNDSALLVGAYRSLAATSYFKGVFESARKYAQQGIHIWNPEQVGTAIEDLYAPGGGCLVIDAMVLWHFGYPDKARERTGEAVNLAQKYKDANALVIALHFACYANQFRGQSQDTLESAQNMIDVCSAKGFGLYLSAGKIFRGWALTRKGELENGLALMKSGIANWCATGAGLSVSYYLALEAEVLHNAGQTKEALSLLDEAHSFGNKFGEQWWLAELYRLQGEILLRDKCNVSEVESRFNLALGVARSQGSRSLELRASMSLYRLWCQQDKRKAARQLLRKVYDSFTEGFETGDLKEAQCLLEGSV